MGRPWWFHVNFLGPSWSIYCSLLGTESIGTWRGASGDVVMGTNMLRRGGEKAFGVR